MNLKAVECCLDHLVFQNIYNFGLLQKKVIQVQVNINDESFLFLQ